MSNFEIACHPADSKLRLPGVNLKTNPGHTVRERFAIRSAHDREWAQQDGDYVTRTSARPAPVIDVLHMIDTLEVGGAEQMAVNLVNRLPRDRFALHLCTTRGEGPLARDVKSDVRRLELGRKWRLDPFAVGKLVRYIRANNIRILHAHASAWFLARIASAFVPSLRVIWHDHYGRSRPGGRSVRVHRLAVQNVAGVISVNKALAMWARDQLRVPAERVWQMNNFAVPPTIGAAAAGAPELSGVPDSRIVCVANLKPEKGHRDLLAAIASVRVRIPAVHLLIVGAAPDARHREILEDDVRRLGLQRHVSFLGQRADVQSILAQCCLGILSSHHEGLPLSLLEYGHAGLPVVATDAGECAQVLDGGRCGMVVEVGRPLALAAAIERMLTQPTLRSQLAALFRDRVETHYSQHTTIRQLCGLYETILTPQSHSMSSVEINDR